MSYTTNYKTMKIVLDYFNTEAQLKKKGFEFVGDFQWDPCGDEAHSSDELAAKNLLRSPKKPGPATGITTKRLAHLTGFYYDYRNSRKSYPQNH